MHPVKTLAIGLLAWPAAEIVAFLCVAAALGFVNAVLMLALTSFAGFLVLRHFGSASQQISVPGGFLSAQAWREGMAPGLGGIFLLIPGFLTSVVGVAVLFPLSRRWLVAGFMRLLPNDRRTSDPDVVDLDPNEWRPLPGDTLPPSRAADRD